MISLQFYRLALCVNKFTHTRLLAIFNLVQLSYILTLVLLSVLFSKKVPKTWAVVYGIRCFLCSRVALRHLSVGSHLAARCLSQCLGRQELAALKHHAAFSNHCSAARCASQRCPLDKLLMLAAKAQTSLAFARLHVTFRLWRGITFCNEQARRIVILNTATVENCE